MAHLQVLHNLKVKLRRQWNVYSVQCTKWKVYSVQCTKWKVYSVQKCSLYCVHTKHVTSNKFIVSNKSLYICSPENSLTFIIFFKVTPQIYEDCLSHKTLTIFSFLKMVLRGNISSRHEIIYWSAS